MEAGRSGSSILKYPRDLPTDTTEFPSSPCGKKLRYSHPRTGPQIPRVACRWPVNRGSCGDISGSSSACAIRSTVYLGCGSPKIFHNAIRCGGHHAWACLFRGTKGEQRNGGRSGLSIFRRSMTTYGQKAREQMVGNRLDKLRRIPLTRRPAPRGSPLWRQVTNKSSTELSEIAPLPERLYPWGETHRSCTTSPYSATLSVSIITPFGAGGAGGEICTLRASPAGCRQSGPRQIGGGNFQN